MDLVEQIALILFGIGLVAFTLLSAIRTFVLPRSAPDSLTRLIFVTSRRFFNFLNLRSKTYEDRDRVMALYAPITLLAMPAIWLILVAIGYTAIFVALGASSLKTAFTVSGSSLLTLGIAPPDGFVSILISFSEATIGLGLIALLIAYLPTIYGAFSRREMAVTLLEVRAGSPPSAVELFARFHRLKRMDKLNDLWVQWENIFGDIEESHTSLGVLAFFRSPQPDRSWITATGAVLDGAALAVSTIDIPHDVQADLTIRAGYIALQRICDFLGILYKRNPSPTDPISISRLEFDLACDQLAAQGVPLKADRDKAWRDFAGWRVNYDTPLLSLCAITMAPYAPWSSDRSVRQMHWLRTTRKRRGLFRLFRRNELALAENESQKAH
jgi:hypothetical protein